MILSEKDLEKIRNRVEKTTEGEWYHNTLDDEVYDISSEETESEIAAVYCEEDAEFITHARKDILNLLDEVRRLREGLKEIEKDYLYDSPVQCAAVASYYLGNTNKKQIFD